MAPQPGSVQRPFPARTLEKALVIIQAIVDKNGGHQMDRLLVADAIGRTPSSSEFKRLLSASRQYGLTVGTEKADYIGPTELGLKIAQPQNVTERAEGLVEASLKPELMGKVLRHFNRNKRPESTFLRNLMERTFDVDRSQSEELAGLPIANAKYCGVLQDISGAQYIRIDDPVHSGSIICQEDDGDSQDAPVVELSAMRERQETAKVPSATRETGKIFVAHGKKLKPVEGLKKVLDQFQIAYTVAIDEPHGGRPISAKVAQLMDQCSAGIFVFTKDERFLRDGPEGEQEEVWRPSENVVYELGAASKLWERRIIILREEGVSFPSDFKDLGYITFNGEDIAPKALDLLKELVQMGLVRVQAA
jgi:predicted nucleotide-binding protein